jgi:hypothetical protein
MVQKLVLRNEIVKVRGRVKVITIKKEDFDKILKFMKLRVLDKEYEALMPPLDSLQKNTIDINGLATLVQQFLSAMVYMSGNTNATSPAQMVLTTSGGNVTLPYTSSIGLNSQGVTVYMQVLEEGNNWTFQYYYVGFDTTNSSYTTSGLELYVSAYVYVNGSNCPASNYTIYTDLVRIAYTNTSFTKSSDSYLFIVWLVEFQNIPPYLVAFTPTFQNNVGIQIVYLRCAGYGSFYNVQFNNGNCNFTCGGNCPNQYVNSFITYVQNNTVVAEFPVVVPLKAGVSNVEVLLCSYAFMNNMPNISGSTSATLTPPISGATFYVAIATITVTYQGS